VRTARLLEGQWNRALETEGVTLLQGLMLVAAMFEEPGQVTPSQLAEQFGVTRGTVSHCLSALEAAGLVKRQLDSNDARSYRIGTTVEGRKRAMRLVRVFDRVEKQTERELSSRVVRTVVTAVRRMESVATPGFEN
jgi:DNA-binding MarR family transcriptional regulator